MRSRLRLVFAAALGSFLLVSTASAAGQGVEKHMSTASAGPPITKFDVGSSSMFNSPSKIVAGRDGNIWFIYDSNNGYGKITPDGVVTAWNWDNSVSRHVTDLAAGPDGNVWYTLCTEYPYLPSIAKITPSGVFTSYIPSGNYFAGGCPHGITAGPDGKMWFTEIDGHIGKITMSGQITEYAGVPFGNNVDNIVAGPDGYLWFTEQYSDRIGQISTNGIVTKQYQLAYDRFPSGIVVGPDNNLWFTEPNAGMIGKLTTTGTLAEYPTGAAFGTGWDGITVGPDGNIWFTQCGVEEVAKITTAGVVTQYARANDGGCPNGIAAGSDGNIWFADQGANHIDRVSPNWVLVQCVVPKVVGKMLAAAKTAIRRANCSVGKVRKMASKKVSGVVISQTPKRGKKLAKQARVNLVVSKGKK